MLNRGLWGCFVAQKFDSKLGWLVPLLAEYSSFDFEYLFRKIYENVYGIACDTRHARWNKYLRVNSLVFDYVSGLEYLDNLAIYIVEDLKSEDNRPGLEYINNLVTYIVENSEDNRLGLNYWQSLTFNIFVKLCTNVNINHLMYLDVGINNSCIKKQNNIFHRLDIEVDNSRIDELYINRMHYFGEIYNLAYINSHLYEVETW